MHSSTTAVFLCQASFQNAIFVGDVLFFVGISNNPCRVPNQISGANLHIRLYCRPNMVAKKPFYISPVFVELPCRWQGSSQLSIACNPVTGIWQLLRAGKVEAIIRPKMRPNFILIYTIALVASTGSCTLVSNILACTVYHLPLL